VHLAPARPCAVRPTASNNNNNFSRGRTPRPTAVARHRSTAHNMQITFPTPSAVLFFFRVRRSTCFRLRPSQQTNRCDNHCVINGISKAYHPSPIDPYRCTYIYYCVTLECLGKDWAS
jgi:hypothetical protein